MHAIEEFKFLKVHQLCKETARSYKKIFICNINHICKPVVTNNKCSIEKTL